MEHDIKKLCWEWYKDLENKKKIGFSKEQKALFSEKDLDEYNILFKFLYFSPFLKNLNLDYNNLNLNFIYKSERPDFKFITQDVNIGIEIKNIRPNYNINSRIINEIEKQSSDINKFISKNDKNNVINKIINNDRNEATGYITNILDTDSSIDKYIQATDESIMRTQKFDFKNHDSIYLVIKYSADAQALNLLNDNKFNKYKNQFYKNVENSFMSLKLK